MTRRRDTTAALQETRELCGLLFAAADHARANFDAVASRYGLTAPQARTVLWIGESAPMRALADHLNCDASNVTGIVDRLEARGLVERTTRPSDRRVKLLALTPEGQSVRRQLQEAIVDNEPLMHRLDASEREELRRLLRTVLGPAEDDRVAG